MVEAFLSQSQPYDLSNYDYDPSSPIPSNREAREYVIAKGPCQPKDLTFPKNNSGRKFVTAWYEKFNWIEYSKKTDKAFCFVCRIFNRQMCNKSEKAFITNGFSNWKKTESFTTHQQSDGHLLAVESYSIWQKQNLIDQQLNEQAKMLASLRQIEVKRKRTVIGRILDVVRLLGRLNLPFRGHQEDENSGNKGVFKEIIEPFSKNDAVMEFHLKNAKGL